jgi:hypothetical protein
MTTPVQNTRLFEYDRQTRSNPEHDEDPMDFRFIAPLSGGTIADITIDAMFLDRAFEQFKASNPAPGWFAVWCGLRLAGHVRVDVDGALLTDLKTEPPRQQSLACGD